MPVIVTGIFILPDGDVAADRVITIRRARRDVVQQAGQVLVPDDVVIETDVTGQVLFDLMPGNYVGFARTASGQSATFTMAVPDVETVDVASVINAEDVPDVVFPVGEDGQLLGYGPGGVLVAVDEGSGGVGPAGASAYEIAVGGGFVGSEAEWLASLVGPAGQDGSDGTDGVDGADGLSAYQVAVSQGFVGSESVWLASLVGPAGQDGTDGTDGQDGASAYDVALSNGFVGSQSQWLTSLVGPSGADGDQGPIGPSYNYLGESPEVVGLSISSLDTFTHSLVLSGRNFSMLVKPKVAGVVTPGSLVDLDAVIENYDVMVFAADGAQGATGPAGTNVTITTVNTQAAFDTATPTATQLIVRIA